MRPSPDQSIPVFAIITTRPDAEKHVAEIFLAPNEASTYLFDNVFGALAQHRATEGIKKDEQISLIFTAGNDGEGIDGSCSLAITVDERRLVWDWRVEKRWAPKSR